MHTLRRVVAGLVLACLLVVASYAVATAHREPAQRPVSVLMFREHDLTFTPTSVPGRVMSAPEVWRRWSHGRPIPESLTVHFGRLTSDGTMDTPTGLLWGFSGGRCISAEGPIGPCVEWLFFDATSGEMVLGTGQMLAQSR